MSIPKGSTVEIGITVLKAGERAPQVPEDTQKVDLEMRVKGILTADALQGETVEITTPTGRCLCGTLMAENPPYTHGYGPPVPELIPVGKELKSLLKKKGEAPEAAE